MLGAAAGGGGGRGDHGDRPVDRAGAGDVLCAARRRPALSNVPKLVQAGDAPLGNGTATIAQKGALLTAMASILRYHQNRGDLRAPNGHGGSGGAERVSEAVLHGGCRRDAGAATVSCLPERARSRS